MSRQEDVAGHRRPTVDDDCGLTAVHVVVDLLDAPEDVRYWQN